MSLKVSFISSLLPLVYRSERDQLAGFKECGRGGKGGDVELARTMVGSLRGGRGRGIDHSRSMDRKGGREGGEYSFLPSSEEKRAGWWERETGRRRVSSNGTSSRS